MIGRWPVGTKPMLPAGSYVTSLGGLYVTMHVVKMVLNVNNHKVLCIQHGMENGGRISWEKKRSIVSINAEKTNNAPNNVERFKVPTVLMVMFSMCNILLIRVTWNIDFVVMLRLYRNGQLFEYNHFKIICHYCFTHVPTSFIWFTLTNLSSV